ncbi:MAG: ABC transporter permease [Marinilabiliaceae bacterium]|nr:ABC transporter permease [Marinilabiliaceae bacterium]
MKRLKAFIKKEFMHIFRDSRTMLILFAMPIAQILIFGYVVVSDINDAKIGILDKSKDVVTREIIYKLVASGYFQISDYLIHENDIQALFRRGDISMVVVFESGFGTSFNKEGEANVQLIADASDANTARLLCNYAEGIIYQYSLEQNKLMGYANHLNTEVRMFYNEELEGVYMSIPGIMAMILILISAMMTSISITREKEFGSMEVLLLSPLRPMQIIVGKVVPYVVLSFVNTITILLISVFVFKVPIQGSVLLLLFVSLLYIILSLSLGIFISTIAKNQMVAMFISLFALMLPTILLSGFIFPIENMPFLLQALSLIMPPRWFVIIVKKIMLQGVGLMYVWKEMLILIGFIVLFLVLSVKKFKVRLL